MPAPSKEPKETLSYLTEAILDFTVYKSTRKHSKALLRRLVGLVKIAVYGMHTFKVPGAEKHTQTYTVLKEQFPSVDNSMIPKVCCTLEGTIVYLLECLYGMYLSQKLESRTSKNELQRIKTILEEALRGADLREAAQKARCVKFLEFQFAK